MFKAYTKDNNFTENVNIRPSTKPRLLRLPVNPQRFYLPLQPP